MRNLSLLVAEVLVFGGAAYGLLTVNGARLLQPKVAAAALQSPVERRVAEAPERLETLLPFLHGPQAEPRFAEYPTFLGMADELLIERMRKAEIQTVNMNRGGSSISLRVDFTDGSRAAFKPVQTNPQSVPRKEAAAYRLARLLGLKLVAPVVMRDFARDELLGKLSAKSEWARKRIEKEMLANDSGRTHGSLAYWIPQLIDLRLDTTDGVKRWSSWLSQGVEIPAEKAQLMSQLSTVLVFDLLQNNSDRFSGGNLLGSPDGQTLYYMDNAIGFQIEPRGHPRCRNYLYRAQKFGKSLVGKLERLTRAELEAALAEEPGAPLLSAEEIDSLFARRDRALAYIRDLCRTYGTERVLVFP